MQSVSGLNELSKTVKFIFGAMPMVGASVSVLTLQRREVIVGRVGLGGEYSWVITKSDYSARVGFIDISKTVKFNFGTMPMVGLAPVCVMTLQRVEVGEGSFALDGECSRVNVKSDNAA